LRGSGVAIQDDALGTVDGAEPLSYQAVEDGIEPRLNAIQRSAEVRGVGLEIQGLDPFRLTLEAADYAALRDALESVVVAFEAAAA